MCLCKWLMHTYNGWMDGWVDALRILPGETSKKKNTYNNKEEEEDRIIIKKTKKKEEEEEEEEEEEKTDSVSARFKPSSSRTPKEQMDS